ncbi:uncharacterized protein LOC134838010 [Culicoides brevitarsis]|uniref:uncharacterized protein LOC134838010 n=1 Tax=Culicoides brevitarsis TaxID=469753 RepID=UPI00307B943B
MKHVRNKQTCCKVAILLISGLMVTLILIDSFNNRNVVTPPSIDKNLIINISEKHKSYPENQFNYSTSFKEYFPYNEYSSFWKKIQTQCAPFPDIFDLNFHNTYWQRLSPKPDVHVDMFRAYYDDRAILKAPVIRIIAAINVVAPDFKLTCQMWFDPHKEATFTTVSGYNMIWNQNYIKIKDGTFIGFLITCPIPENATKTPLVVSLVTNKCDKATNSLKVENNRPPEGMPKKDFAVCVKGMDFLTEDLSIPLVEFVETNLMFGVDKIVTYNLGVHPNMTDVLNYYIKAGKMEVHPISLPANYPNDPFLRHLFLKSRHTIKILQELIPYNDCFYKNMHLYKYIMLLDIDEVFVPTVANNYKDMLQNFTGRFSSIFAHNKIFVRKSSDKNFNEMLPRHLDFLQTTTVAKDYEKPYILNVKSFFNTEETLTLNNHMPYECFGKCIRKELKQDAGQLNHYRKKCDNYNNKECKEKDYLMEKNEAMLRFKDEFIERTNKVLKELQLIC